MALSYAILRTWWAIDLALSMSEVVEILVQVRRVKLRFQDHTRVVKGTMAGINHCSGGVNVVIWMGKEPIRKLGNCQLLGFMEMSTHL